MTAGFQVLFVGAFAGAGEFPYLLPSGGSVGELTENVTTDGECALAVGVGHWGGHELEAG